MTEQITNGDDKRTSQSLLKKDKKRSSRTEEGSMTQASKRILRIPRTTKDRTSKKSVCETNSKELPPLGANSREKMENGSTEDSFEYFGKYISSVLRKLPLRTGLRLQQKIFDEIIHVQITNHSSQKLGRCGSDTPSVTWSSDSLSNENEDYCQRSKKRYKLMLK